MRAAVRQVADRGRSARANASARSGHPEVSLDEIYQELARDFRHPTQRLQAAELAAERLVLRPNPAIAPLFDAARASGATIVAISDSYFTATFVQAVLSEAGLPVHTVFMSGELGKSKHEGDLFEHVAASLGVDPASILHIGDDLESDYKSALKAGCSAWHSVAALDRLFRDTRYNQAAISGLAASEANLFASAVVGQLALGTPIAPDLHGADLFGRMYAGPMLLAFAQWLEQIRTLEGVKRLYLVSRDGCAVDEVLELLGSTAERIPLYSSRRMCYIAVLEQEFETTCLHIASSALGATAREAIAGLQVCHGKALLSALSGMVDLERQIASVREVEQFAAALRHCRQLLVSIAREEREAMTEYMKPLRLTDPDAAVVDCGWALSSHRRLEMLAGGRIRGYYVGTIDHAHHHELIRSFLFEKNLPSLWKSIHADAVELLELPFISSQRQSIRMARAPDGVVPVFSATDAAAEAVRRVFATAVWREALAFCRDTVALAPCFRTIEAEEALRELFASLTQSPTSFEYYALSKVPHTRALGVHEVTTIADYWRCPFNPAPTPCVAVKYGPSHFIRIGLLSLRRDGVVATCYRVRRRVRRWLRALAPAFTRRLLSTA